METVLKKHRECFSWLVAIAVALLSQDVDAQGTVTQGNVSVARTRLQPGQSIDLTGEWLYKPGYLVQPAEQPQLAKTLHGYVAVPVPQLLNRTQWWLDDSEDFKKFEEARLEKLGFDTERAEDGWYQLQFTVPALPGRRHIFIEFDGVAMKSKAFLNGQLLGEHIGMFSRFAYDLTPHLKVGRNRLAIFVSMEKIPSSTLSLGQAVTVNLTASKILTLSKGMFGPLSPDANNRSYDLHGIWQPVKLVIRDSAMIDDAWFIPSLDGARVQVDDIHRYRGRYSDSPFVSDTLADIKDLTPNRPLIGQEMSTGYPDLDAGLPVLRYTRDLLTPQAWVGQDAYPGSDPAVFLEHHRAVTKRWAEQLRFQHGDRTAGFMLFSAECWFAHSYDAGRVAPYPVHSSQRQETTRHRSATGSTRCRSLRISRFSCHRSSRWANTRMREAEDVSLATPRRRS